jgi:hypothetical protein
MFNDLATYFYHAVVGDFEDYLDGLKSTSSGRSRDVRKAVTSAEALYHFREHLPTSASLTRRQIATNHCLDYDLLGDVVNAIKHKEVTQNPNSKFKFAKDIVEQIVVTSYLDAEGEYKNVEKTVVIYLTDGTNRNLEDVLVNVMNFWQRYLHSIGVIHHVKIYTLSSTNQPKPREECNDGRMDFDVIQGLPFTQSILLQRYNYSTEKVEPVDLTGCSAQMNIYKPPVYEIIFSITNDKTGEVSQKVVALTESQTEHLKNFKTEEELQTYLNEIPTIKESFLQLAIEAGVPIDLSKEIQLGISPPKNTEKL